MAPRAREYKVAVYGAEGVKGSRIGTPGFLTERPKQPSLPKNREQHWLLPLSPLRQNFHTSVFTKYSQE